MQAGFSGCARGARPRVASTSSRPALGGRPTLTAAARLSSRSSGRRRRCDAHMFPRDADFATQQLQGIISELRADPDLAPLLDDARVAAAIKAIAADPSSLQQHSSCPKVMRVLERLLGRELTSPQAQAFAEAGTSPAAMLTAINADAELSALLANATVRAALAAIRHNPAAGMARWGSDPLVSRALDLLEAALQQGGNGQVVDVVASEVAASQRER